MNIDNMRKSLLKEVNRVGYYTIAFKFTKDENIMIVLAHSKSSNEFVTWIFNVEKEGLYHGRYFSYSIETKEEVQQLVYTDFNTRE